MRKFIINSFAITGIVVVLSLAWLMLTPIPMPFSSLRWQKCTTHSDRFAMHHDLLWRHQLVGMTRAELFQLLGDPDGSKDGDELQWNMGSIPAADDNSLLFELENDKVVSFSVFQM